MTQHKQQSGFTLLELLIALTIFAVLSTMAYSGLNIVLNTKTQTEQHAERLSKLQTAMIFFQRDIEQAIERSIRDSFGDSQEALAGGGFGSYVLELTRAGYRNPLGTPRSELQRVAYHYEDNTLTRLSWTVLDRSGDPQPYGRVLLEDVEELEIRYMDAEGKWQSSWPPGLSVSGPVGGMPRAVEISMDITRMGKIRRVFRVPPGESVVSSTGGNN